MTHTLLYAADRGYAARFEIEPVDSFVRVRWHLDRLGEPFPGGNLLVKDPVLVFETDGQPPVTLPLITAATRPENTVCGVGAFRRMRGLLMPRTAWSYAVAIPPGSWRVRFTAELFDCVALTQYCDALNIYAGEFMKVVGELEAAHRLWHDQRGHGGAPAFRWPCDLALGEVAIPAGHQAPPTYFLMNELELPTVSWEPAPAVTALRGTGGALQPERYFDFQARAGIPFMRRYRTCRYGTHKNEHPIPPGNTGTGLRCFLMWGTTFGGHYALTGDRDMGEAAWFAVRHCLEFIRQAPNPHGQHSLTLGLVSVTITRFALSTGRLDLLEPLADIWRRWPYDWQTHVPATEPSASGGDLTANDTYNMKLSGLLGIWMVGHALGDSRLLDMARDGIEGFILPAITPAGYWHYRPNAPEGKIVNGIQSHNHYDTFVKCMLGRLLAYPEWRDDRRLRDTLRRGLAYTLGKLGHDEGRTFYVRDLDLPGRTPEPPRVALAESLGRNATVAETLAHFVAAGDLEWLPQLARLVQWCYDQRDHELLADYWDNSWMYGLFGGLFQASLHLHVEGSPEAVTVRPR